MTTPIRSVQINRIKYVVRWTTVFALCSAAFVLCQPRSVAQETGTTASPSENASQPAPVRYEGTVASTDPTAKSFVINTEFGEKTVTVTTTDSTEFHRQTNVGIAGLQVGDSVRASGTVDEAHSTIAVRSIAILDRLPANPKIGPNAQGKVIIGTVASVSPTVTLTPVAGITGTTAVTVQAPTGVRVTKTEAAGFDGIAVGRRVRVDGQLDGANFAAKTVTINEGGGRRARQTAPPAGGVAPAATATN